MNQITALIACAAVVSSCQSSRAVQDYKRFYERQPQTVLVLPVVNETTSAEAPAAFSSTIASPLLRRGYSVLPVLPSAELLRSEGIYEGQQVALESLAPFRELIGADAVIQVTLHSWDTNYMVLASSVEVQMTYRMLDTETGEVLWEDSGRQVIQSDSGGGSIIGALVSAAVTAASVEYVELARQANMNALTTLPAGPMSPRFERDRSRYLAAQAKRDAEAAMEAEE